LTATVLAALLVCSGAAAFALQVLWIRPLRALLRQYRRGGRRRALRVFRGTPPRASAALPRPAWRAKSGHPVQGWRWSELRLSAPGSTRLVLCVPDHRGRDHRERDVHPHR